jgi:uncharacterized CHY-type Zn-finger protein
MKVNQPGLVRFEFAKIVGADSRCQRWHWNKEIVAANCKIWKGHHKTHTSHQSVRTTPLPDLSTTTMAAEPSIFYHSDSEESTAESKEIDRLLALPPVFAKKSTFSICSQTSAHRRRLLGDAFAALASRNPDTSPVVESNSEMALRIKGEREKKRKRLNKRAINTLKREGKVSPLSPFLIVGGSPRKKKK